MNFKEVFLKYLFNRLSQPEFYKTIVNELGYYFDDEVIVMSTYVLCSSYTRPLNVSLINLFCYISCSINGFYTGYRLKSFFRSPIPIKKVFDIIIFVLNQNQIRKNLLKVSACVNCNRFWKISLINETNNIPRKYPLSNCRKCRKISILNTRKRRITL